LTSSLDVSLLEVREREYSPSSCIGGNYKPFVNAYKSDSIAAQVHATAQGGLWTQHSYGASQTQQLDFCRPKADIANPSLLVFIHGGYWQELNAKDSLFPAKGCIDHGVAFAAIDYTLAPHASLSEIVAECRAAISWLVANSQALGFDARRIVIAGSSAGAHLAAMVALTHADYLHGMVLVSGIYELAPLIGTSINEAMGLTTASARELSPLFHVKYGLPRAIVCWGEIETMTFKQQSENFANSLRDAQASCTSFEVSGRNHFDIILDLTNASTPLGKDTLALLSHK
jgi:arylformamidase